MSSPRTGAVSFTLSGNCTAAWSDAATICLGRRPDTFAISIFIVHALFGLLVSASRTLQKEKDFADNIVGVVARRCRWARTACAARKISAKRARREIMALLHTRETVRRQNRSAGQPPLEDVFPKSPRTFRPARNASVFERIASIARRGIGRFAALV